MIVDDYAIDPNKLDEDHLLMTDLATDNIYTAAERANILLGQLDKTFKDYQDRRHPKTLRMQECWAAYLGTPYAEDWLRETVLHQSVGDIKADWRHKINRGKAYEVVETIVPYLKGATFPNDDWFDIVPTMPIQDEDYELYIKVMKYFIKHKLDICKFREKWEIFLRQLCITGTSVLALPWRLETRKQKRNVTVRLGNVDAIREVETEKTIYNAPDINVEDMMDTFLDPDEPDGMRANLIRRMRMSRGQIVRLVNEGAYNLVDAKHVKSIKPYRAEPDQDRDIIMQMSGTESYNNNDLLEVYEFWGSISVGDVEYTDVVATWCGRKLLRFETNPYWCGRPFIVATYTPLLSSPYGLGAIEPVLGDIHETNIIGNSRLDGLTVSLLPTYLYRGDGTVNPDDLYVEPGRFIPTNGDPNAVVVPMAQDLRFANVSIQEEQLREQAIDRRTGTGSFIGAAPGRSGERVTAEEVNATREAGGSRLSGVYEHIETTSLVPAIERCYGYMQQFIIEDEIVPVPGRTPEEILYASVGIDQLQYDFFIRAKGAAHVADKEYELRQRADWIALMNSNAEMAKYVDWNAVAKDLARRFTGEDANKFIKDADMVQQEQDSMMQQQMQQEAMQNPEMMAAMGQEQMANSTVEAAQQAGGNELAMGVQAQLAADGGANLSKPLQQTAVTQPVF